MALLADDGKTGLLFACQAFKESGNVFRLLQFAARHDMVNLNVLTKEHLPAVGAFEGPFLPTRAAYRHPRCPQGVLHRLPPLEGFTEPGTHLLPVTAT